MHDSYSEMVLPFGSKPELLEQYINASGSIRVGKLIEHLDSLAGSIAYKHVLGPGETLLGDLRKRGFFIVTAAVDRLDMLTPLNKHNLRDLRLCGHVIYTGRSSIEVAVKIALLGGTEDTVMLGRFSMVCRDAFTPKAKPVPPLELSTAEEEKMYQMGAANKERKMSLTLQSLTKVPPSTEEAAELHQLYLNYGQDNPPTGGVQRVWMVDTRLENCFLMFPQERNVHSKIFGGYLMRLAYELSFTTAALFSRRPLRFLSLDGLAFRQPVPIGSILRLRSQVAFTALTDCYPALVHITVRADVVDVTTGIELTTDDFRFTWCDEHGPPLDRKVVPKTYHDAMEWIEAKRALEMGNAIRNLRDNKPNSG
ncbi:Thioesterase/thiol ester dehydrase-isomerase [Hysterangium stoloniferum]|nr:Thioesterase/thiol ester dehydrase-isomerase [Hysterangium stoloniferum]